MTRIGGNVSWQMPKERLASVLEGGWPRSEPSPAHLMHALNLYDVGEGLGATQRATISSMEAARRYSRAIGAPVRVDFVSVQVKADRHLVPESFAPAGDVRRTSSDLGLTHERSLPLVFDILDLVSQSDCPAETVVFTNSDICLQTGFYTFVSSTLAAGYDSLIINRRTLLGFDEMCEPEVAAADLGEAHPGLDCFVFPRSWVGDFATNEACVGAGFVMRGLLMNLVAHADSLLALTEAHLTYHLGDDRVWTGDSMRHLQDHNLEEADVTFRKLATDPEKKARLHDFFDALPKYRPRSASQA